MNFTDREKQLLLGNAPVLSRITLYDEDGSVLQVFNEDDYIVDWELEDYRYVPDQGFVGQFVERLLDGNFMNIPDELSLEDKEIEVEIAVVDNELEEQVYHNYGRFVITKIEKGDVSGSYKFESSDYAKKFNVPVTSTISYPCTSLELLNNVCEIAGVELDTNGECLSFCVPKEGLTAGTYYFAVTDDAGTTTNYEFELDTNVRFHDTLMLILDENKLILKTIDDDYKINRRELTYATVETSSGTLLNENLIGYVDFINNDFVVEDNQFEEQDSCRTVVSSIAKLGYTWARINENNKLCLDFVKNEDVNSYDEIDTDKYYEARVTGDKVEPVNKVLIGMSNVDGENIVKEQDTDLLRVNKISGETSQESYTGKNLLNTLNFQNSTLNGITGTYDASTQTITFNGTCTSDNTTFPFYCPDMTFDGTYTLWFEVVSGTITNPTDNTRIQLQRRSDWSTFSVKLVQSGNASTRTWADVTTNNNNIRFDNGVVVNNFKIRVQIEKNSYNTSWERYVGGIPSPNPDYPQNVNTVTGRNVINVQGKNLCDEVWELGNIQDNGAEVSSTNTYRSVNYYNVRGGETLICSYIATSGTQLNWCACYDKNRTFITRLTNLKMNPFTLPNNTAYIRIGFYKSGGISLDNFSNVMLVYGSTAIDYELHKEQSYEIDFGKNLFDKNNANILSAYFTSSTTTITSETTARMIYISCKANTTYTIQKTSTQRFAVGYTTTLPANNVSVLGIIQNNSASLITITTGDDALYLCVLVRVNNDTKTLEEILASIQVEEGPVATPYTPYHEPIELCKMGTYQDYIYKENGEWYLHKETGKVVLNGSESRWGSASQINNHYRYVFGGVNCNLTDYNIINCYSNTFRGVSRLNLLNKNDITVVNTGLQILTDDFTTLDSFKTWLSSNNVDVYYIISTATDTEITYQPLIDQLNELDKIGLFKGINYITTDTLNEIPTLDITTTNLEQEETNYSNKSFDITSGDYSDGGTINVFDNPLTHSEELRRIAINGSENLLGLTYTPMEVESIGHPWLSGKEYMKVTNLQDDDLFFYPFDRKIKYNGALTTDLSAEAEDDTSQKYENRDNVIDRLHHTEIDVDKANQQITSLVQEVSDTNDKMTKVTQDVNSVSTQVESINKSVDDNTKNIATIQQTIAGISVETSITGGTNLIKNSVGYFGNDFWMVNDDTEGNVKTMNDNDVKNNSISANALLLQNETIYQKITEIKNGSYYISFRYKRLLTTATCKLIINGEEFNLTSTSWKDEGKEIPVTSNNIQISLVSDKNDSCLVTDLIVSNGTSKVSWTQNANETFTDGVKIGKGITITATGSDTELSATASSIDIVNTRNRESTSTFDKYGIKTNSLESKGTIRVADKLIISRVGDQMWISTL